MFSRPEEEKRKLESFSFRSTSVYCRLQYLSIVTTQRQETQMYFGSFPEQFCQIIEKYLVSVPLPEGQTFPEALFIRATSWA